jgi:hypothetical protein
MDPEVVDADHSFNRVRIEPRGRSHTAREILFAISFAAYSWNLFVTTNRNPLCAYTASPQI